jgi:hypothetical protein
MMAENYLRSSPREPHLSLSIASIFKTYGQECKQAKFHFMMEVMEAMQMRFRMLVPLADLSSHVFAKTACGLPLRMILFPPAYIHPNSLEFASLHMHGKLCFRE